MEHFRNVLNLFQKKKTSVSGRGHYVAIFKVVVSCDLFWKYVVFSYRNIIQAMRHHFNFYKKSDYFHNNIDENRSTNSIKTTNG